MGCHTAMACYGMFAVVRVTLTKHGSFSGGSADTCVHLTILLLLDQTTIPVGGASSISSCHCWPGLSAATRSSDTSDACNARFFASGLYEIFFCVRTVFLRLRLKGGNVVHVNVLDSRRQRMNKPRCGRFLTQLGVGSDGACGRRCFVVPS